MQTFWLHFSLRVRFAVSDIMKGFEVIKHLTGHADMDGVYEILEYFSGEKSELVTYINSRLYLRRVGRDDG